MKINQAVMEIKDEMIQSIIELVKIPSVIDETHETLPFGKGIDDCLQYALKTAEGLGFSIYYDPEGYFGYAEIGTGDELIGVLGHLDVVPEGDAHHWKHPPYSGEIENNKIYGRGTQDDKGPLMASMFAVKALMNLEVKFNKRVRIIFGTDEENRWRGINKYMEGQEVPSFGFAPDASFPVINAEKGLLQIKLINKKSSPVHIKGGNALNAVPESIVIDATDQEQLEKMLKKLGYDHENNGKEIVVIGRSAHASKPNLGINAINRLMVALNAIGIESPGISFLAEKIGLTNYGEPIFGNCQDEPSGKLTLNVGQIDFSKYGEVIGIDIRFPVTIDVSYIEAGIKRVAKKYGLSYERFDYLPALYMEEEHPLIKKLLKVYEEETGLDGKALSTGGATYARAMKNCVAFGASFPGQEKSEHQVDENIDINLLVKATQIYAKAILALLE